MARTGWVFGGVVLAGCSNVLEDTTAPPGDPAAFAPFAHTASVAAYAGPDAKLIEMTAGGVPPSGKIALGSDHAARVDHKLIAKDDKGRYVSVSVSVTKPRVVYTSNSDNSQSRMRHLGMERSAAPYNAIGAKFGAQPETVALPKCDAADLWKKAIATGAPATATATIVYNAKGYELRIVAPQYLTRRFGLDCSLIAPDP